jgi:catechol 2,3-dioxygenase-like lactoylglutathione lyase family enzyme
MKYLHTMVRVSDIDNSLDFYCTKLGLKEVRRSESQEGRFTLIFLAAEGDEANCIELTHNWTRRNIKRVGTSGTSPTRSKTFTRLAND